MFTIGRGESRLICKEAKHRKSVKNLTVISYFVAFITLAKKNFFGGLGIHHNLLLPEVNNDWIFKIKALCFSKGIHMSINVRYSVHQKKKKDRILCKKMQKY